MGINDFESRIRGGYNFFQIRISDQPVNAPCPKVNLLVALNQKSYDAFHHELTPDGLAMMDVKGKVQRNQIAIPIDALAVKAGKKITANTGRCRCLSRPAGECLLRFLKRS